MSRWTVFFLCLFSIQGLASVEDFSIGAATVTLNDRIEISGSDPFSYQVNFPVGSFTQTPAVFLLPDNENPDPMTLRVYDVTTSGFKVFVSEAVDNFFGGIATNYPAQALDFLAIQPGNYTVNGVVLQVGLTNINPSAQSYSFEGGALQQEVYQRVDFINTSAFTATPVVISELQSVASDDTLFGANEVFTRATEPFLELVQRVPALNPSEGFEVSLERLETGTNLTIGNLDQAEQIAWLAIEANSEFAITDDFGSQVDIKAFTSSQTVGATNNRLSCDEIDLSDQGLTNFTVNSSPIYLASQITRNGFNGSFMRQCASSRTGIFLRAEEDYYDDNDRAHINESVNIFALSNSLIYTPSAGPKMIAARKTLPSNTGSGSRYLLSAKQVNFSSLFGSNFIDTPIIVPMTTDEGTDGLPSYVRVWDVTASGFKMAQTVPEGETAAAQAMTVDFLAVVPGIYALANDIVISAGSLSTLLCKGKAAVNCTNNNDNTNNAGGYQLIDFPLLDGSAAYQSSPVVLSAPQSINNDVTFDPAQVARPFITTSTIDTSASNFKAAFDFAETNLASPLVQNETLGWIAITNNLDTTLRAAESTIGGNRIIELRTAYSTDSIEGWGNGGCYSAGLNFQASLPLLIGSASSRDGNDGGWLRRCGLPGSYGFRFDEDRAADNERNHITEQASVVAFSQAFAWTPFDFLHQKTVQTVSDPVNSGLNPKAIPEAILDYSLAITATSRVGIDQDTISVSDNVPSDTQLYIGDLDSNGCPVVFNNTGPANLTFTCADDFFIALKSNAPAGTCSAPTNGFNLLSECTISGEWTDLIQTIKIEPDGELVGSIDSNNLSGFTIRYRIKID